MEAGSICEAKPHLDRDLPLLHLPGLDLSAGFHDFKPAQIPEGFMRPFDGPVDRILNRRAGGSVDLDDFIDGVFHRGGFQFRAVIPEKGDPA